MICIFGLELGSLCIDGSLRLVSIWVPSENNPVDAPHANFDLAFHSLKAATQKYYVAALNDFIRFFRGKNIIFRKQRHLDPAICN